MVRSTFIKKLKEFGDAPIPEGHARRNKGFTTYFFDTGKRQELECFLSGFGRASEAKGYIADTFRYAIHEEHELEAFYLYVGPEFLSVSMP